MRVFWSGGATGERPTDRSAAAAPSGRSPQNLEEMMTRRKKVPGKCRICGKEGELSFEHVPPQSAFNEETVIEYTLESWTTKRKAKGKQRQGGIGEYTLCEQCNNDTGSWYGDEYVKWAKTASDILLLIERHSDYFSGKTEVVVTLRNTYPLRFLKQVVTCLFSVAGISPGAEFSHNNPELVKFVLERHETRLPPDYQFYLRLYQSPILRRYPIAGKLTVTYNKDDGGNILPHTLKVSSASILSEMTHPPFAITMTYDTGFLDATNITHFKNYKYDEQLDLVLPLMIGRSSTPYPGSYQPL